MIPVADVRSLALSPDGALLAIGRRSTSLLEPGLIQIIDVSEPQQPKLTKSLEAQSSSIFHMEFSPTSNRFLSVGQPSNLRKSSGGLEEELMVWSDQWERIDVKLADDRGALPKFQRASFSADGSKILTTNPAGLGREQFVNVFSDSPEGYQWTIKSPVAHLNCAAFRDDDGSEIVASARNPSSGNYSLLAWDLVGSTANLQSNRDPNFISIGKLESEGALSTLMKLDNKILNFWRADNWLLMCGEDRQTTLWNLATGSSTSFRGHSRAIDFCSLLRGPTELSPILISVASAANPEILKTDLAKYQRETLQMSIGSVVRDDQPSPTTLLRSSLSGKLAFANDQGLAAIVLDGTAVGENLSTQIENGKTIQWEVSAWKHHVLTDDFLFAQSRRDEFYQFDRRNGELVNVLTRLAENRGELTEITDFQVSRDGRIAVVTTNEKKPQFEVWDLKKQEKVHTIEYGKARIFGSRGDKELPTLRISPDGKMVVAAKLGLFAWSTVTGEQLPITQPAADAARSSVSGIQFLPGTSKFLASWKGRVDLFDLNVQRPAERFNLTQLSYSKTEPNILDVREDEGRVLVLARWTTDSGSETGIGLLELGRELPLKLFGGAKSASFSHAHPGQVIVVTESADEPQLVRYDWLSNETTPLDLQLDPETRPRFRSLHSVTEMADGRIVLQSLTRNLVNPVRRNWNSVSCNPDLTPGRLRVFAKPPIDFCAVAGQTAITLDQGNLRFWNVTRAGVRPAGTGYQYCRQCALSPDEKRLAVVPRDGDRVLILDPVRKSVVTTIKARDSGAITALGWSSDSHVLSMGDETGTVRFWRQGNAPDEFINVAEVSAHLDQPDAVSELSLSADGTSVLSMLGESGLARVSHLVDGKWTSFILRPEDGQKLVRGDISADGRRAVTGSEFGRLTIWNTENLNVDGDHEQRNQTDGYEREIMNLQDKHQSAIRFVRFLPNSNGQPELVSAEEDAGNNGFVIWNARRQDSE